MKWPSTIRLLRIVRHVILAVAVVVALYVLSIGPATYWVVSAVSGQQSAQAAAPIYDRRLSIYLRLYSPFFAARIWTWYRVTHFFEDHFWRYEQLFARPRRLADGREVFSTIGEPVIPGEPTSDYVQRLFGSAEPAPKRGTEVHALPRTGRVLVVLDPNEADMVHIVLDAAIEHSVAPYALLKIP